MSKLTEQEVQDITVAIYKAPLLSRIKEYTRAFNRLIATKQTKGKAQMYFKNLWRCRWFGHDYTSMSFRCAMISVCRRCGIRFITQVPESPVVPAASNPTEGQ